MFKLKIEGLEEFKKMMAKPFQEAMAKTLNQIADDVAKEQTKMAESSFKTFNQYSRRSLFVWKTNASKPVSKQNIVVGSFSPYLGKLETGFRPKPMSFQARDARGQMQCLTGRPIATKYSRNPDGTIKRSLTLDRLKKHGKTFFLNVRGHKILFMRKGKRLHALRIFKDKVGHVREYEWHEKALKKVYRPGLVQEMFNKILKS